MAPWTVHRATAPATPDDAATWAVAGACRAHAATHRALFGHADAAWQVAEVGALLQDRPYERSTLLVVTADGTPPAVDAVVGTEADLVVVDSPWLLEAATDAVSGDAGYWPDGDLTAACDDPDATAAGTITAAPGLQALGDDAVVCFPAADDPTVGAYAVVDGERRVTALSDGRILTNAHLADEGNAALVLRTLGRHERLVWYLPSAFETMSEASGPGTGDILPPWVPVLGLQLLLVVLVAAVWRGRRLGRVVPEPLPVVVPAAETTRGRGRLYRRSRSY
ncbi:DUF4350 domain-containing protein, partial [Cellulomonas septica]